MAHSSVRFDPAPPSAVSLGRVVLASLAGSVVEWYDYFLYGTAAGLVFGELFFPSEDELTSLMASFATFAVAFFFRPFGAAFFGSLGDRVGRKAALMATLTLMGLATGLIGILPGAAAIGIFAPALLVFLRILQGFALGGEWSGAILLALEHAPRERRAFFGSLPQIGPHVGFLLGLFAFEAVTAAFGESAFRQWAWRIPFLLGILGVPIGLWLRRGVGETPDFLAAQSEGRTHGSPLRKIASRDLGKLLAAVGIKLIETAPYFLYTTFLIGYGTKVLGIPRSDLFGALALGTVAAILVTPVYGKIADRPKRAVALFAVGAVIAVLYTPAFFTLVGKGTLGLYGAMLFGLVVPSAMMSAVIGTLYARAFPPEYRYTGAAFGYHIGSALAGGTMPYVAAFLLSMSGGSFWTVSLYLAVLGGISLVSLFFLRRGVSEGAA
ncbi:MAG: MFS transporter [Brockia lithotrophica]|nr:MFS transporter [Brockia lithotrophica]